MADTTQLDTQMDACQDPNVNDKTYREIDYLKRSLGPVLVAALAEVCIRRPADPVEYLGHWLLRWKYNEELKKRDLDNAMELVRCQQDCEAEEDAAARAGCIQEMTDQALADSQALVEDCLGLGAEPEAPMVDKLEESGAVLNQEEKRPSGTGSVKSVARIGLGSTKSIHEGSKQSISPNKENEWQVPDGEEDQEKANADLEKRPSAAGSRRQSGSVSARGSVAQRASGERTSSQKNVLRASLQSNAQRMSKKSMEQVMSKKSLGQALSKKSLGQALSQKSVGQTLSKKSMGQALSQKSMAPAGRQTSFGGSQQGESKKTSQQSVKDVQPLSETRVRDNPEEKENAVGSPVGEEEETEQYKLA